MPDKVVLRIYIYFYLQKLQVGLVDAACRERQYATKNMARTNFLRKIWRINPGFLRPRPKILQKNFDSSKSKLRKVFSA
jgi:hypothetical protein